MFKKSIALGLILAGSVSYGETTTSSTSETKVKAKKAKKVDKADEVITNRRMRASGGSLSDISISTSLGYDGGSLNKPFAADRPRIDGAGESVNLAALSGSIAGTYRINKLNRISIGTGFNMTAPFNSSIQTADPRAEQNFKDNQGKLDVANPYISYSNISKIMGVQTVFGAGITEYTNSNLRDAGFKNDVGVTLNTMYDFGGSAFSIGAYMAATKFFYDSPESITGGNPDVTLGFMPQAEYVINDTFNLRTIIRSNWYNNTVADTEDYKQRPITQSVGLGISVNRDIFLYPNIQFAHANMQADNTNVGISASINMF